MSQKPSWDTNERTVAKGVIGGVVAATAPAAGFAFMSAALHCVTAQTRYGTKLQQ